MTTWERLGRAAYYLAWPALYVYLRIGHRTRVLVMADKQVLLVQSWLSDGKWGLPGGGLHRHENPAVGAVRETVEETDVPLLSDQCVPLDNEWGVHNGLGAYYHFFAARLELPITPHAQRGEIVAAAWFSVDELKNVPHRTEVDRALELWAAH